MTRFLAVITCLGALLLAGCEPKPGEPAKPKTVAAVPAWR
jgi:hypothetical protein